MWCSSLTNIIIPDSVTNIGNEAFSGCTSLTNIIIPDSVNIVNFRAFAGVGTGSTANIYTTSKTVADLVYDMSVVVADLSATINIYLNNEYYKTWTHTYSCFAKGTMITLADGSRKVVEELTYDDKLLVWNFDEGKYDTSNIVWLTRDGLKNDHYYKLTFSDGSVLKTTGVNSNHKIYNVDERIFNGVDKTEVGDRIYSENEIVSVVSKEYIEEEVEYYNLITGSTINCFADGILASDRYSNMYDIDNNMKYIKNNRVIRDYSEFESVGISKYWYDNLRLGEQTESLEKTREYINKLESQMEEK